MYSLDGFYLFIDPVMIWIFRLPGNAEIGFALGLVWVALIATIIGELSMAGIYFLNRRFLNEQSQDMVRNFNLSLKALAAKDKQSYKACNDLANEAFGKNFFTGITLFASSIWPAFFALGWLDFRFKEIDFPLPFTDTIVSAAFYFVPTYIIVRIIFARLKPKLPVFGPISRRVKADVKSGEQMMTYMDIVKKEGDAAQESAPPQAHSHSTE